MKAQITINLNSADEAASFLTWARDNGFEYLLKGEATTIPPQRSKETGDDSPALQAFYQAFPGARLRVNDGETRETAAIRRLKESPEKASSVGFDLETLAFVSSPANEEITQRADENDAY